MFNCQTNRNSIERLDSIDYTGKLSEVLKNCDLRNWDYTASCGIHRLPKFVQNLAKHSIITLSLAAKGVSLTICWIIKLFFCSCSLVEYCLILVNSVYGLVSHVSDNILRDSAENLSKILQSTPLSSCKRRFIDNLLNNNKKILLDLVEYCLILVNSVYGLVSQVSDNILRDFAG